MAGGVWSGMLVTSFDAPLGLNGSREKDIQTVYLSHSLWGETCEKIGFSFLEDILDYNLTAGGMVSMT